MKIISREPKTRKHIDPIVVEYLNKKGLLEIYESYLRSRIKQIIKEWSPESLFEYPFNIMSISWSDADEGSSFWCDIHYTILSKSITKRPQYVEVSQLKDIYEDSKKKS